MSLALKVLSVDRTRRKKHIVYEPTFSSTYVPTGETADLTAATNPGFKEAVFPGAEIPERIFVENGVAGLDFAVIPGILNSNHKLKVFDGAGVFAYAPGDLKGATSPAGTEENADQASGPVNAALIDAEITFTAIGEGGTTGGISLQPDVARNVNIVVHNTTGGALDLFQGVTTFAVLGVFRGLAQTENIIITSSAGNKSVAAAKFRYKAGVKPFDSITSITVTNIGAGTLSVSVAPGTRIGLPADSENGVDGDYSKFEVDAANVAIATNIDHTNKTAKTGTTADAWDMSIVYRKGAELPAMAYPASLTGSDDKMRVVAVFRAI